MPVGELDRLGEQHYTRSAVHVIVTVDQDSFARGDGGGDALDGGRHIAEGQRIVQFLERRMQKTAGRGRVCEAAMRQHFGRGRTNFEGSAQRGDDVPIGCG